MLRSGDLVAERYELAAWVGSGGMGTVWQAHDVASGRTVALKRPHSGCGDAQRAQLQEEARIARLVGHPNAVSVFEVTDTDCWLVMEYVDASSLAELIEADGPMPADRVTRIGAQIAGALAAAHAAGVVHRDVTPSNVLIGFDDQVKVTDFGISVWREATLTESGKVSGKPAYLAPEVADGGRATAASDVFSLGATLFAALEGSPPFGTGDAAAVLARARTSPIPRCSQQGALAELLAELMTREPGQRPTATGARDSLAALAGMVPTTVPAPPRRRGRWALLAGATAMVLAAGVIVWAPWDSSGSSSQGRTAVPVLGDPRTADPCALTDVAALGRFGEAERDPNYGGFNRCDVLVDVGQSQIDVMVQFLGPAGPATGSLQVRSPEVSSDACTEMITLADGNRVDVTAKTGDPVTTDLCALAGVARASVVEALGDGEIPRRVEVFPANSLAAADACALMSPAALAAVPGFGGVLPDPGFANWSCRWDSPVDDLSLRLFFEHAEPLTARDGTPARFGDHDAFVELDGYGDDSCRIGVVHRDFADPQGRPGQDQLLVVVTGDVPPDRLCATARSAANLAATALPRA